MEVLPLRAFSDNYIWLLRAGGAAVVVDPGDAGPVLRFLDASGDRLAAVLVTHHHRDHVGGIADLLAVAPAPVFGPAREVIPDVSRPLSGGERVELPELGLGLDVLSIPGHTRGHLAYYAAHLGGHGAVFCGDTLFGGGCGRVFEGTPAEMQRSLATLAALPPDTRVYCAHEYTQDNLWFACRVEPENVALKLRRARVDDELAAARPTLPTTIALELATNPFLRWHAPDVREAAAHRLGRDPVDAVEVFATLREWKSAGR